jgi:hypothetical protein
VPWLVAVSLTCAAHFRTIAPSFRDVPELIRKQFIYAEDGWAGGVYLWQTQAAAEQFYAGPWLDGIRERYGMDPQIKFFQTACITDNASAAVLLRGSAIADGSRQRLHPKIRMKNVHCRADRNDLRGAGRPLNASVVDHPVYIPRGLYLR